MNLFVFGWNVPRELRPVALDKLSGMIDVYPQLDPNTIWSFSNEKILAASMHTKEEASFPRRYVYHSENEDVFYDGCLIDSENKFDAMDATDLCFHWDRLRETLEGQFLIVRVDKNLQTIELLNDFLGMGHAYYYHKDRVWLVGNSVELIREIIKATSLDPLGISLFLTMGWVGSDRTLRSDIRLVPGGAHWRWRNDSDGPIREQYYSPHNLSALTQKGRFTPLSSIVLSETLTKMCDTLARNFGELECPITGGRDSRVLVSLLIRGGIKAQYYTDGSPHSSEVQVGKQISEVFDLPYGVNEKNVEDLKNQWENISRRIVKQNDGMISLWQVVDILHQPEEVESLCVRLWGIGGEIARGYYSNLLLFIRKRDRKTVMSLLIAHVLKDYRGIIRKEAIQLSKDYLFAFAENVIQHGFSPIDIPDVFYAYERVRRWAGDNARKVRPVVDLFSPFSTRPFVESAFSLPPLHRCSEPIHYRLVLLVPKLHKIPFEKEPWRCQIAGINLLEHLWRKIFEKLISQRGMLHGRSRKIKYVPAFDQYDLLEGMYLRMRERCLDQSSSMLWSFIDRSKFEKIMLPTTVPEKRREYAPALYQISTLFYYSSF